MNNVVPGYVPQVGDRVLLGLFGGAAEITIAEISDNMVKSQAASIWYDTEKTKIVKVLELAPPPKKSPWQSLIQRILFR